MPWLRIVRRRTVKKRVRRRATKQSRAEHQLLGAAARALVEERLVHFNRHYGYVYHKVFIRNTRTRWGSCSSRGNLGFNYRIVRLSPPLVDYIVVHELCHLKEFNHSPRFWALVAECIPQWKLYRRELRKHRL
jgi:predicted metal-dependent hydrolase